MSRKDVVTKEFMKDTKVFADAFNYFLHDGEPVISPGSLEERDTDLAAVSYGSGTEGVPVQKYRDLMKRCSLMQDGRTAYLLMGIENQSEIHYAMPVRNMVYDALQYAAQYIGK